MQTPWLGVTYWLASPSFLILLSYRTQDHQSQSGPNHDGLPSTSLTKQENILVLLTARSHEGISQLRLPHDR